MLSPADMLVVGVAALLFFGPDQLPKVARRAGQVVRDVQATSASFIREMERAADESDAHPHPSYVPPEPYPVDPQTIDVTPESHVAPHADSYASDAEPPAPGHTKNGPTEAEPPKPTLDSSRVAPPTP